MALMAMARGFRREIGKRRDKGKLADLELIEAACCAMRAVALAQNACPTFGMRPLKINPGHPILACERHRNVLTTMNFDVAEFQLQD